MHAPMEHQMTSLPGTCCTSSLSNLTHPLICKPVTTALKAIYMPVLQPSSHQINTCRCVPHWRRPWSPGAAYQPLAREMLDFQSTQTLQTPCTCIAVHSLASVCCTKLPAGACPTGAGRGPLEQPNDPWPGIFENHPTTHLTHLLICLMLCLLVKTIVWFCLG
jgi:hypothetical protein